MQMIPYTYAHRQSTNSFMVIHTHFNKQEFRAKGPPSLFQPKSEGAQFPNGQERCKSVSALILPPFKFIDCRCYPVAFSLQQHSKRTRPCLCSAKCWTVCWFCSCLNSSAIFCLIDKWFVTLPRPGGRIQLLRSHFKFQLVRVIWSAQFIKSTGRRS